MPIERGVSTDEKHYACGAIFTPASLFLRVLPKGGTFLFYNEARHYISNIERAGSDYGIERMRELLVLLDEPDKDLKFVHIAGTNGKGSVSAYMTSILFESGYRVGTYNSPSVLDYNERWLLDGKPISDTLVAKYLTLIRDVIEQEQQRREGTDKRAFTPTAFEIETALAMLAFKDFGVDICVLETGLGGRWDATNVIKDKEIAIITPIGLDHTQILGNTIEEVASEKSAITHDRVVTCKQSYEIMQEIAHPFDLVNGERMHRDVDVIIAPKCELINANIDRQLFSYNSHQFEISLLGEHQLDNASIAICACHELNKLGWSIIESDIRKGLRKAKWHARFEVLKSQQQDFNVSIPQDKVLVLDGSHNPHGAKTLAKGIEQFFFDKRINYVFGVLKDKDVDGIVDTLAPYASKVYCVTPNSPRALDNKELKDKFIARGKDAVCVDDIKGAIEVAFDDSEVVIVCGSLTLFAKLCKERENE